MMILHAPHSILKTANTHVPNLISDLQSNKNEGKKGQRHLDKGISHFCTLETEVCFAFHSSICQVGGRNYKIDIIFRTPETQPLAAHL